MTVAVYTLDGCLLDLHKPEGSVANAFVPKHQGCIVRIGNESFKVR